MSERLWGGVFGFGTVESQAFQWLPLASAFLGASKPFSQQPSPPVGTCLSSRSLALGKVEALERVFFPGTQWTSQGGAGEGAGLWALRLAWSPEKVKARQPSQVRGSFELNLSHGRSVWVLPLNRLAGFVHAFDALSLYPSNKNLQHASKNGGTRIALFCLPSQVLEMKPGGKLTIDP